MAKAMIEGREVEIVGPDDWTTRELYDAEKALGMTFDGSSAGAGLALTMFISLRRVEPAEKPLMLIADEVMGMKFGKLAEVAEEGDVGPPDDAEASSAADQNGQPTTGAPLSAPSE